MMKRYTFTKEERLCSKRLIDNLFRNGSSFILYPYRIVFLRGGTQETGVQVLISVSKRKFGRAVDRNLIKRRVREAYRLQKEYVLYPFIREQQTQLIFAVQYIAGEIVDYSLIHARMGDALKKLQDEFARIYLGKNH